jgi:hypothetical protein
MGRKLTVIVIIADDNLLNLPIFTHLTPEVLVKCVEVIL